MKTDRKDRHDPTGSGGYLPFQHVERYIFAKSALRKGMRTLDIACGAAYGTAILLDHGCDVVGADIDKPHIENLKQVLGYEKFEYADATNLPFDDECFDAVVTFETIEHVLDGDKFLSEMRRVLKPGGILLCSTPNIRYENHPPEHVKEYRPEEFYALVDRYFEKSQRYGQYFEKYDFYRDGIKRLARNLARIFLRKSSAKKFVRNILGGIMPGLKNNSAGSAVAININSMSELAKMALSIGRAPRYSAKEYVGDKLLRIMIVSARKPK